MMRLAIAFSLVALVLSACGAATEAPADGSAASDDPTHADASTQPGPSGGTWTGTLRRQEQQTTQQSGGGTASEITQTYDATVTIQASADDPGRWTLVGQATIASTFSSDWVSRQTSPLGPCNQHFTDEAEAKGTGAIEGGLEIEDDFYQLRVQLPNVDGTMNSVRDDTGCFGSRTTESNPWSAAQRTVGASGRLADPNVIAGSSTEPDGSTVVTTTWNLRRTP